MAAEPIVNHVMLGTTFTSIIHMIVDRKDNERGIHDPISSEPDHIYIPTLAREYIKLKSNFTRIDPKKGVVASNDYKWFIWKVLQYAIGLHKRSRDASAKLAKICMFLQTWEEEAFPGMITIYQKDPIYSEYRTILEKVQLLDAFSHNNILQLGNTPIITIIQNLKKNTGGKRKTRKQRKHCKQRKTRKN